MGAPTQATDELGRRALALWAVALWLLGFELAPNLHLGFHGRLAAHSHRPANAHGERRESGRDATHHDHGHGDHHHGDAQHHHDADHHHDDGTCPDAVAQGAFAKSVDLDHGQHDLLHRGIAALPPPPVMPRVVAAPFAQTIGVPPFSELTASRAPMHVRARGPPRSPSRASPSAV